jgi:hypothetical protein
VHAGGALTEREELRLPPGQRLDRSAPNVLAARRPEGWVVAYFSAWGATRKTIEQVAWSCHADIGEAEYP